jgi:hypothetical protein
MRILIISLFIINLSNLLAQDFNNYQPLICSGPLPSDFTDRTSEKAAEEIKENINSTDSYKDQKAKSNYLLKSNYMLDELLMSGRVLFGDPVSEYVNTVADKLLENEPELKKELRFYCLKSNVTNAFCTNQGMIFVTLGLIAQLENEAQLAQVLAHEITHYTKKHVINTFIESSKISNTNGKYKYSNYDDNIIKLSNYSKTLEFEADSVGFFRLRSSGYSIQEALTVFDVLQFSYLPFDEQPFSYSYFETDKVKIPDAYKIDTILPILFEDDYDDSKSTHPNIKKRREKIINLIKEEKKGEKYIQSKELFKNIRTICRFENIRLNNKNASYVKAIYNAQVLMKDYPNSDFLKRNILKSLYGISKYKTQGKYYKITEDYDDYEGEISAAYYFFEELSSNQINSITLEKTNEYYLANNKDESSKKVMQNLIYDLVNEDFEFKEFYELKRIDSTSTISKDSILKTEIVETKNTSKYAKLRAIKQKQENSSKTIESPNDLSKEFHHEYIYNASNANEIKEWFDNTEKESDNSEEKNLYEGMNSYERRKAKKKAARKLKKNNVYQKAGIKTSKIVFVDPDYFVIDERKGQKLENAEQKKYDFYKQVDMVASKAGIEYEILSPKVFKSNEVDKYNDLAKINDWVGEKMLHENFRKDWSIITSEAEYVNYLSGKYNTDFFLYTGVLQYKEKKDNVGYVLATTILYFPLLPYGIYYTVTPKNYTYYYNLYYNLDTGVQLLDKVDFLKIKANQANINSLMYDMLIQIKK